jgi:hypothetical protein
MKLSSMVAGLTLVASVAQAQTVVTAKLTAPYAPGGTAVTSPYGYYMSPYSGTIDNGSTLRFNCVDYFHEVTVGESWQATTTNLGAIVNAANANDVTTLNALLANTREGVNYPLATAVQVYQQAALLTTMYGANPGANATRSSAIQTAIWAITTANLNPTFPSAQWIGTGSATENTTGYWINYAQSNYQTQTTGFYDQFNILTDLNRTVSGNQEFIYSTPEPGSIVLMATGLFGVAGFGLRRRRKNLVDGAELPA